MKRPSEVIGSEEPDAGLFWRWVWDSVRPVLGYVLVGVGLIALFVGWYKVSGESLVAKQLPYIASAGFLGVALVVLGARFMLIDDIRKDSGRLDRLETMVNELHAALLARPDAPGRLSGSTTSANGQGDYVVLPGGQSFHTPDCPMLEGKDRASRIRPSAAARRGLTPCPLCEPTAATAEA